MMKKPIESDHIDSRSITQQDLESEINSISENGIQSVQEITGEHLLSSELESIPCLIEPIFQKVGLACLAGSSDTGKSALLRQLAISVVSGQNTFLDFNLKPTYKSVIYVSTEDDLNSTAFLLKKQFLLKDPKLLNGLRFLFDSENVLNELEIRLKRKPADLVIIDCFADVFKGNLKETQEIRTFLNLFQQLASKHKCLILFLHHTGKRTETLEPSKNNLLSGQGFEAKMRLVVELRADLSNPVFRHLCIVKGNYLPGKLKRESFCLKFNEQNFVFEDTGEKTPFENLIKNDKLDADKAKFVEASKLKLEGKNYDQIAQLIGYESKSSVSKLLARAKKWGW